MSATSPPPGVGPVPGRLAHISEHISPVLTSAPSFAISRGHRQPILVVLQEGYICVEHKENKVKWPVLPLRVAGSGQHRSLVGGWSGGTLVSGTGQHMSHGFVSRAP